jgi:hypothetical protein
LLISMLGHSLFSPANPKNTGRPHHICYFSIG